MYSAHRANSTWTHRLSRVNARASKPKLKEPVRTLLRTNLWSKGMKRKNAHRRFDHRILNSKSQISTKGWLTAQSSFDSSPKKFRQWMHLLSEPLLTIPQGLVLLLRICRRLVAMWRNQAESLYGAKVLQQTQRRSPKAKKRSLLRRKDQVP